MNRKYLGDEVFKKDTFEALSSQFKGANAFNTFYMGLSTDDIKNDFLRVGTAHRFFVKSGDWHVNVERADPVIGLIKRSIATYSPLRVRSHLLNTTNHTKSNMAQLLL